MYNEIFAFKNGLKSTDDFIDNRFFLIRHEIDEKDLERDFYLKYFTRELLIDIDILLIEEFLLAHYLSTNKGLKFLSILKLKILPKIDDIINGANLLGTEGFYTNPNIENKFVKEIDGFYYNEYFNNDKIYHHVAYNRLQSDLNQRRDLIKTFIKREEDILNQSNDDKLTWKIDPSVVGYIISELTHKGYIQAPFRGKKINNTALTRQIITSFNFSKKITIDGLKQFVIRGTTENIRLYEKLYDAGFEIAEARDLK